MEILKIDNDCLIHTVDDLKRYHESIQPLVQKRLQEFSELGMRATKEDLFRELVFCILTANASAKMGLKSVNALDAKIFTGSPQEIEHRLRGLYRFPTSRADYICRSRQFLEETWEGDLQKIFTGYEDDKRLREYLKKNIVGIGYKECSHFLRNIGFKGLAILDKHVVTMLNAVGCYARKPRNGKEYEFFEHKMIDFAEDIGIDIDELDLVFWSFKTGEIIK